MEKKGWGVKAGGTNPYLRGLFSYTKEGIEEDYIDGKAIRVVIVPLNEWRRLKKMAKLAF